MPHVPVLSNEVMKLLDPKPGEFFIDGTFGGGGHSRAILNKIGKSGKLLILDWDESALNRGKKEFIGQSAIFVNENFAGLPEILKNKKLPKADGLLLDLGFSSDQIENSGRGFSFNRDEPLLMTYENKAAPVRDLLKRLSEKELADIIWRFGEERYARRIAAGILSGHRKTPIKTSGELAEIVRQSVPANYERGRIHPATRTFQALRIYANKELDNLESVLKNLDKIIKSGGRAAIISFHSLEDRLVKNYFRDLARSGRLELLTKKPIMAGLAEIKQNVRSRSAKLRAAVLN